MLRNVLFRGWRCRISALPYCLALTRAKNCAPAVVLINRDCRCTAGMYALVPYVLAQSISELPYILVQVRLEV